MAIDASGWVDFIISKTLNTASDKEKAVQNYLNAAINAAKSNPVPSIEVSVNANTNDLEELVRDQERNADDVDDALRSIINDYSREAKREILAFKNDFEAFVDEYFPIDDLMVEFKTAVRSLLNGKLGIPDHVEYQIWERDRSRVVQDAKRAQEEVLAVFAARGFPLPPGAAAHAIRLSAVEAQNKIAQHSRDVAIKQADIALQSVQAGLTSVIQMHQAAIGLVGEFVRGRAGIGNNVVPLLTGRIDAYTKLQGIANDFYRARIDAEKTMVDVGLKEVELRKDIALAEGTFAVDRYKALTETISRAASAVSDQAAAALNAIHASASVSASGETD